MKATMLAITFGLIALGLAAFVGVDQWRSDEEEPFGQAHPTEFRQFLEGTPEGSGPAPSSLDAPRYTQEEVVAIIMNYEFDFQNPSSGKTERLTVQASVAKTLCGGIW